ncbi:pyridoxal-phosphate dependent enzyme [Brevibacillus humidisoli]|uniref:threonine synthase n=1 Tax=Brevibacillus humidisoli TaxID=2895522 RepID=UPI001E4B5994|nr:pyridoxal-phosphate dependent enzyme [Brevibacillus humidisoli]UFJ40754.1 pyridoxal-phosphate dependent enzyme [Brevibacillus humidisoli]
MVVWNELAQGMRCIRCGNQYSLQLYPEGCLSCRQEGAPASLTVRYRQISRHARDRLPFSDYPDGGASDTPLVQLPELAERYGIGKVWLKQEGNNPTGSHKDRMSPLVIAHALSEQKHRLVIASSGNAGVSLAYYAHQVGLSCTVIMAGDISSQVRHALTKWGAVLVKTEDSASRWEKMKQLVYEEGYYPATNFAVPPVGSNPFGVQGYKTVAYELAASAPDYVLVPTARGDLLWGIYEGFCELLAIGQIEKMPKLIAVEPFPRLTRVFAGEPYTAQFTGNTSLHSIAGGTVTYQAAAAVDRSGGTAIAVSDQQAIHAQEEARSWGIPLERSAASVIAALDRLASIVSLTEEDTVVLVGTSRGEWIL